MKKYLKIILPAFILLFGILGTVKAAGSVSASFSGSSSVTVGNTVSLNINLSNVQGSADGKAYSFGGYVTYDPQYLQYQSFTGGSGWTGTPGTANNGRIKIATVDYTLSQGVSSGTVGTIKFKALKAGNTNVSMNTIEATDQEKNLTVNFSGKSIAINEYVPPTPKSSNSNLASLSVSGYSITPSFNKSTKSYSVTVPSGTSSVNVIAAVEDSKATLTGTGVVNLTSDTTTATVKVTAEDGSVSNYTITINREKKADPTPTPTPSTKKSSDASLKSLSVSGYALSPRFSSGTKTYSMNVANGITGLKVSAVPNDSKAKVSISGASNWSVGNNVIKITVTAEDGSQSVYKVNVNRASAKVKSKDTNVDLTILSAHTMTPNFSNNVNEYFVTVANDVEKLDLKVTPYDKNTKVKISGNENLAVDKENKITIKVTAEDGTSKTITLNVTRSTQKSAAELLDVKVKDHTLDPTFDPKVTTYNVDVDSDENKLDLIIKAPEGVIYEVTGNENFQAGKNIVLIKVTDKNGFEKYYQINVNKKEKKEFTIFGLGLLPFLMMLGSLLLLLLLLFLMLKKRKEDPKPEPEEIEAKTESPINIDFKPEFNFNSNNGTDDDIVYAKGDLNNGTDFQSGSRGVNGMTDAAKHASGESKSKEEVYDIYDDVVTKDELIDAMNEATETNDSEKLEMLLEQENLNRKKEAMKKRDRGT